MYLDWVADTSRSDLVVVGSRTWPWSGTGVNDGDRIPGVVGQEVDKVFQDNECWGEITIHNLGVLHNRLILAASKAARGNTSNAIFDQNSTLLVALSDARVFSAGTMYWSHGLEDLQTQVPGPIPWSTHAFASPTIQRITRNILSNFACGRLGILEVASPQQLLAVAYQEFWSPDSVLRIWQDPRTVKLAGRFGRSGRTTLLFASRHSGGGTRLAIVETASADPPVKIGYWEAWGQTPTLDGWLDEGDIQLAGVPCPNHACLVVADHLCGDHKTPDHGTVILPFTELERSTMCSLPLGTSWWTNAERWRGASRKWKTR